MRGLAVLGVVMCLLAMAQAGNRIENSRFYWVRGAWKLSGGAKYAKDPHSLLLPGEGAKVTQKVELVKGANHSFYVGCIGTSGSIRVRVLQGGRKLTDARRRVRPSRYELQLILPDFVVGFDDKPIYVVITAEGASAKDIRLTTAALFPGSFALPLAGGEWVRNADFEEEDARAETWETPRRATYSNAEAYTGAMSMNLKGLTRMTQSFHLTRGNWVMSCAVTGGTSNMRFDLESHLSENRNTLKEDRLHYIDHSTSSWQRWAQLHEFASDDERAVMILSADVGGFGYADDCSLKPYAKEPQAGHVKGSRGVVFRAPLAGNQWMRNGDFESGFEHWNGYIRRPAGGDDIQLSMFSENAGPKVGVLLARLTASVFLYQRFELPQNKTFELVCQVTDRTQSPSVFFLRNGAAGAYQVTGSGFVGGRSRFGMRKASFNFSTGADNGVYAVGIRQGADSDGKVDNCLLRQKN